MNGVLTLVAAGGPVILALMALSVLLYSRCFLLLMFLRRSREEIARFSLARGSGPAAVRRRQEELRDGFRQERFTIGAMITAAPLLGLLGTVMGMIGAFDSLAALGERRSMEGLAHGISEVLIATESGLAVAIPAVLVLYFAHHQTEKGIQKLATLEMHLREGG